MNSFTALLAAVALVAPVSSLPVLPDGPSARHSAPGTMASKPGPERHRPEAFRRFANSYLPRTQHQVRIEQRVIIRISPSPPSAREELLARLPRRDLPTRFQERRIDDCVPIEGIAGVTPLKPNRLLLFMRDHRVLSAALERACDPEAFYLGFYVERSADGLLCSKRDKLQSRTGSTCEVASLSRLVAVKD